MNTQQFTNPKIFEDTDIIIIGNKTRLCKLLIKKLNYLIQIENSNTYMNDYLDSNEFLRKTLCLIPARKSSKRIKKKIKK